MIIALAGMIASGKATAAQFLCAQYGAVSVDCSDALYETLDRFGISHTRENPQKLSRALRNAFGQDILGRALVRKIETISAQLLVIQGIHRLSDVAPFLAQKNFFLIFIDADAHLRFLWHRERNKSPGDAVMTFDDFLLRDCDEAQNEIESLKNETLYVIRNEPPQQDFLKKFDALFQHIATLSGWRKQ